MHVASEIASPALRGSGSESERVGSGLKVVDTCAQRTQHAAGTHIDEIILCDTLGILGDCGSALQR